MDIPSYSIDFKKYPLPKRLRHHAGANLYVPYSNLKKEPEYYPPLYTSLNWVQIFKNSKPPDELDIGCGKGAFLLSRANQFGDRNILGIELRETLPQWLNEIIEGEGIPNCAVIWHNAANGLSFLSNDSILNTFYLFPDPWPKRKHLKRRLFSEALLTELYRIVSPEGRVYIATDVEELHNHHLEVLKSSGKFNVDENSRNDAWNLPVTNKEAFCKLHDIPIFKIILQKKL
ncbi:MAG: trmB [Ignavibacteria bacterium]|nr:trmB [Ignavibacteria bacterium]